jgi:simple sugar transport system permease protein
MSMLGLGLTGTLYRTMYGNGGASLHTPTIAPVAVPGLSAIPILGPALFDQPVVTYALYAIVPALAWWFYRSAGGLALRAVGEHPEAARGAGISPDRVQWAAILFGGAMGGIGGGTLVLAQVGTFAENMSAGRGFIAIAIVVLGRWTPFGVAGAALVFGAASALQTLAQTTGWAMPYQLPLAFPYVLTLVLLASSRARTAAPAALGQVQV